MKHTNNKASHGWRLTRRVIAILGCVGALAAPISAQAQNANARALPPIIFLLLSEDVIEQVRAIATGQINDTGVTVAGISATENSTTCSGNGDFAEQDCNAGRDVTANNNADGTAGFSFTKVDENGVALAANASQWSCVLDNVTGLLWEVKTTDGGLQDASHTYSWFDSNPATNGGAINNGVANGGTCVGANCDTESFVNAVNAQGLCGFNDWRMPTMPELIGIVDMGRLNPSIDTQFFPNVGTNRFFWSGSPFRSFGAFRLSFFSTGSFIGNHSRASAVRVVRAGQ